MSHVGIIFRVRYTFLLGLIQCVNGIKSTGTVSHRGNIETWASPTATIFSHLVFLAVAPNRLVWHKKCKKYLTLAYEIQQYVPMFWRKNFTSFTLSMNATEWIHLYILKVWSALERLIRIRPVPDAQHTCSLLYASSAQAGDSCRGVDRRVQPDGRGGAHAQDCPGCGSAARRRQGFGSTLI